MKISLLTGANDPSYALPLTAALTSRKIWVDFIGNNQMEASEAVKNANLNYLNFRGDQDERATIAQKILRVCKYYSKLITYTARTDSRLFHILWLNKFTYLDRTLLNVYYKIWGKKLVFTAHNVNAEERDGKDSIINRWTLKFMYWIVDSIFVHTEKMKRQLIEDYGAEKAKITVIPFGINNHVPFSQLCCSEAKARLHLEPELKVILFFGQIAPYKGLDRLILALAELTPVYNDLRLIIAGRIKIGWEQYWESIKSTIDTHGLDKYIIKRLGFIPDEEVEVYFKSADVLVLPYRNIFQTGVLFLSYNFGLPVVATDVGSLREDIIHGETGYICQSENPQDIAAKIEMYFHSDLYKAREEARVRIREWAMEKYSWEGVAERTCKVYADLLTNLAQ